MFALLEHAAPDGLHWDLLIELPDREGLATWRLSANPLATGGPVPATRISDHRRVYLEYEGEVSRGRGSVRRLDRGDCFVLIPEAGRLRLRLAGELLHGEFELDDAFRRVVAAAPA